MSSHLVDLVMHHIDPGVSIEGTSSRRNRRYRWLSGMGKRRDPMIAKEPVAGYQSPLS
jgi:hypothetical protein